MGFSLVSLIHNILKSSALYIRHFAVHVKEDLDVPVFHKEASNKS
jgi:hypothetical protein